MSASSQSKLTVLGPSEFGERILSLKAEIVHAFIETARGEIPAATFVSTSFLKDHLPEVIASHGYFLIDRGNKRAVERLGKFAQEHGQERARSKLYTTAQIRSEYAIVREITLSFLRSDELLSNQTVNLFAQICEVTLSETIESFLLAEGPAWHVARQKSYEESHEA